jgi:N-acetylneuraminate lyase
MIRTMKAYPFHSAMKEVLKMLGFECGPCRLPQRSLAPQDAVTLHQKLEAIGFFEWGRGHQPASLVEQTST